jgi:hypothetical protein
MDRRDPPPAGTTEGRPADGFRRRFSGLSRPSGVRHVARARLIAAIVLGLALLALLLAGGSRGLAGIRAWIHGQDIYLIGFDEIELSPAPPLWIRSGARGILESVRKAGHWDRPISLLDPEESEKLARSFALDSPWVEKVLRVEQKFPRKLIIQLRYREPVAYAEWSDPDDRFVIDGEAILLPLNDLDRNSVGPLPRIMTQYKQRPGQVIRDMPRPYERKPGYPWKSPPEDSERPDAPISKRRGQVSPQLGAARMAMFLKAHRADDDKLAASITRIYPDLGRGIYLSTTDQTMILWEDAPGDEPPGSHDAETKWRFLKEWVARQGKLCIPKGPDGMPVDYLVFGRHAARRKFEPEKPATPR